MKRQIKLFIAAVSIALFGSVALVPATATFAIDPLAVCDTGQTSGNEVCNNRDEDAGPLIKTLVNVLLFLAGAIAVIMIIWGGITYITSTGDSGRVQKAKNTIMYSVIGLVLALVAFAIVNFIIDRF